MDVALMITNVLTSPVLQLQYQYALETFTSSTSKVHRHTETTSTLCLVPVLLLHDLLLQKPRSEIPDSTIFSYPTLGAVNFSQVRENSVPTCGRSKTRECRARLQRPSNPRVSGQKAIDGQVLDGFVVLWHWQHWCLHI